MAATTLFSLYFILFFTVFDCFSSKFYHLDASYCYSGNNVQLSTISSHYFARKLKFNLLCPLHRWRFKSVNLISKTSNGFCRTSFAVMKTSKHGFTCLSIPGHDPPTVILICMDIHPNPGPVNSLIDSTDLYVTHSTSPSSGILRPSYSQMPQVMVSPSLHSHFGRTCLASSYSTASLHTFTGSVRSDLTVENSNSTLINPVLRRCFPSLTYSRTELFALRHQSKESSSLSSSCFSLLKDLKIFRFRGKRGGSRSQKPSISLSTAPSCHRVIHNNPEDLLSFCLLNSRSINNKSLLIKDYVVDRDINVLTITETWLKNSPESDYSVKLQKGVVF